MIALFKSAARVAIFNVAIAVTKLKNVTIGNSSIGHRLPMAEIPLANIKDHVGQYLGASEWITIDQPKIDQFAACTGDRQWIHVDVERASRESPFGGTIAHGYLSLSLVAPLAMEMGRGHLVRAHTSGQIGAKK